MKENHNQMKNKDSHIKGYILKIKYPGCRSEIGDFEPYTTGYFSKYPELWEPVYTDKYLRNKNINKILETNE